MHGRLGDTTLYGSSWDPAHALALLRARAVRHGAELRPVDGITADTLAAVLAADAWMWSLTATDLHTPARHGPAAVGALARILARAAGQVDGFDPDTAGDPAPQVMLARAEAYAAWACVHTDDVATVLLTAAYDLAQPPLDARLVAMASALEATATAPG
jgi:hypothetical protein